MKITKRQLRNLIREVISTSAAGFPPVTHPLLSPYFDQVRYQIKADKPDAWFREYIVYSYKTSNRNQAQSLTLYLLPDGRYHARVTGSYENTLSGTVRNFDNPDDAISAALDSSPDGRPPSAAELLVKVGEELEPAGWYGID